MTFADWWKENEDIVKRMFPDYDDVLFIKILCQKAWKTCMENYGKMKEK